MSGFSEHAGVTFDDLIQEAEGGQPDFLASEPSAEGDGQAHVGEHESVAPESPRLMAPAPVEVSLEELMGGVDDEDEPAPVEASAPTPSPEPQPTPAPVAQSRPTPAPSSPLGVSPTPTASPAPVSTPVAPVASHAPISNGVTSTPGYSKSVVSVEVIGKVLAIAEAYQHIEDRDRHAAIRFIAGEQIETMPAIIEAVFAANPRKVEAVKVIETVLAQEDETHRAFTLVRQSVDDLAMIADVVTALGEHTVEATDDHVAKAEQVAVALRSLDHASLAPVRAAATLLNAAHT